MNVIFLLQPYTHNHIKRVLKSSKLYFYDTGLVCYLMNYNDPIILMNSEYAGHIFECYAISEIVKGYVNECVTPSIYYLQDPNHKDKEIDLIIESESGILFPIEIKKNVTPKEKFFNNFSLLKPLGNKVGPKSVICCSDDFVSLGDQRYIVPVH
jgi:predicted AAA+ superfamily ATPase